MAELSFNSYIEVIETFEEKVKIKEFQEKFDEEILSGQSEGNGNFTDEIPPDR